MAIINSESQARKRGNFLIIGSKYPIAYVEINGYTKTELP